MSEDNKILGTQNAHTALHWLHQAAIFVSPFIMAGLTVMFIWMQKLDDRQYSMKDEYLSKADFNGAVGRLETSVDNRLAAFQKTLDANQAASAQQTDRVLTQLTQLNEKLNQLSIELEKKTK